jgi:hypothetical protein
MVNEEDRPSGLPEQDNRTSRSEEEDWNGHAVIGKQE